MVVAHTFKANSGELEAAAQGQTRLHRHFGSQEQRKQKTKTRVGGEEEGNRAPRSAACRPMFLHVFEEPTYMKGKEPWVGQVQIGSHRPLFPSLL